MLEEEISPKTVEAPTGGADGEGPDLEDPALYFNRELSWLDFNERVLELAEESSVPLLERVKFCAIYASNLDEFFMVRVAGLFDQVDAGIDARGPDGLSPGRADRRDPGAGPRARRQAKPLLQRDHPPGPGGGGHPHHPALLGERVRAGGDRPALPRAGLPGADAAGDRPRPALPLHIQPLAQPRRPAPRSRGRPRVIARVKVPKELLGRFMPVGEDGNRFVALEDVIAANLDSLFPGTEVIDHGYFRVTRDADFTISDEADDLLQAVQEEIRARRFGEVVRLEVAAGMNPILRQQLIEALRLEQREVYEIGGLIDLADLWDVAGVPGHLGAALRAVDAGDPAAAAGRRGRGRRHLLGDPQGGPARPSSLRLVLDLGRALRRAGRRRPRRAGDQADRVPDQRRLAAGPLPDPCLGARQAGGLHGRAEGPLRRGGEHPVGEVAGGGGRPRRLRHPGAEDARQGDPRRPPRGRQGPPLRPRRHRQLPPEDGPPLHRPGAVHRRP